jgi:hypothetical protein
MYVNKYIVTLLGVSIMRPGVPRKPFQLLSFNSHRALAMGDGRWAMGDGRWAMGDGRWAMGDS